MLILSRVCAEFHDHTGAVVYRVTPETRLTFREAPESIREDPLFRMLMDDGSLEAAVSGEKQRQLEADPMEGADAAGRKTDGEAVDRPRGKNARKQAPEP